MGWSGGLNECGPIMTNPVTEIKCYLLEMCSYDRGPLKQPGWKKAFII